MGTSPLRYPLMLKKLNQALRNSKALVSLIALIRALTNWRQDLKYGHLLAQNEAVKNRHLGDRCFLFATGMTLQGLDLSAFKNEITFGCNRLYENPTVKDCGLSYFVMASSPVALWGNVGIPDGNPVTFYQAIEASLVPDTEVFMDLSNVDFLKEHELFKEQTVRFVARRGPTALEGPYRTDLSARVDFADGVAFLMALIALYMGCKEIYLFGFGWTYQPVEPGHFYDNPEDLAQLDHTAYAAQKVPPLHQALYKLAKEQGAEIFNVTPEGHQSPVYPPVTLEEVLKKVRS